MGIYECTDLIFDLILRWNLLSGLYSSCDVCMNETQPRWYKLETCNQRFLYILIISEEPASCPSAHPKLAALHSAVRPTQALRFSSNQGHKPEVHCVHQLLPQAQPANQNGSAGKPRPIFRPRQCNLSLRFQGFAYMKQRKSNLIIGKTNDHSVVVFSPWKQLWMCIVLMLICRYNFSINCYNTIWCLEFRYVCLGILNTLFWCFM